MSPEYAKLHYAIRHATDLESLRQFAFHLLSTCSALTKRPGGEDNYRAVAKSDAGLHVLVSGTRDYCIGFAMAQPGVCFVECAGAAGSPVGEGFQVWPEWGATLADKLSPGKSDE